MDEPCMIINMSSRISMLSGTRSKPLISVTGEVII